MFTTLSKIGTGQWMEYDRQWPAGFHKNSIETLFLAPHSTALFDDNGEITKIREPVMMTKLQVKSGMRKHLP